MGKRIGAAIVDVLIYSIIGVVLFFSLTESGDNGGLDPCGFVDEPLCVNAGNTTYVGSSGDAALIYGLPLLYAFAVLGVLQGVTGSTPGKALFGLRTVRRDTGQICGVGKSVVRWLLWIVDGIPYCAPLVGLVTSLATTGHKRVGDMAANTAVVHRGDVGVPLDGAPAHDTSQPWAGAPAGGYSPPPPAGYAPPPPAGYAPPPPAGYAPPAAPVGGYAPPAPPEQAPPPGDFLAPNARQPLADHAPLSGPPVTDYAPPTGPPVTDFAAPAPEPAPPITDFAAPAPEPAPPISDYAAPAPEPAEPPAPQAPMVASTQPPATSEPQWDAARNTYIQWDPVLAAWMQWDEPGQRWKAIDT